METTYLESDNYKSTSNQMFHFSIAVYTNKFGGDLVTHKRWEGYVLEWLVKWRWYFEYRAALYKVQNPRYDVVVTWGRFESKVKEDIAVVTAKKIKQDITTAKRMKTKFFNAIEKYKVEQSKLLIADWNNPQYLKALAKLELYTNKLNELQKL